MSDFLFSKSALNITAIKFKFNGSLGLFHVYDEAACIFECRMARAAQSAKCAPWDYPTPGNISELPICIADKMDQDNAIRNFEENMSSQETLSGCNCLPNCEEVSFITQVENAAVVLRSA